MPLVGCMICWGTRRRGPANGDPQLPFLIPCSDRSSRQCPDGARLAGGSTALPPSASHDLGDKLRVYRRNGVREYLVWRVPEGRLDWFELTGGVYRPRLAAAAGVVRSTVFPGLWLDVGAMLRGDHSAVLRALHRGLAGPGHAAFASRLADERSS